MYDNIVKAQRAYELGDIASSYHFINSAYTTFIEKNTNYTLSQLATLDQCFLAITNAYAEFKESELLEEVDYVF